MANALEDITGIAIEALQGASLALFSPTERMEWAAGRETKREEDWVYSLLGIFDVSMALIYGEGRLKALRRLKKEIGESYNTLLPVAEGASFDSHVQEHNAKCLPDTRVALIDHINKWAEDRTGKPIFWLNGMAGTGKSTVARTIARLFADRDQLGATFFFKKGDGSLGNADRFFTTLATELMASIPQMALELEETLRQDQLISAKSLKEQFERLILNPLLHIVPVQEPLKGRIIVIDALDECERDEDIREILRLLSRTKELAGAFLRVFVTSRPELYIRLGFKQMSNGEYENFILHEVADDIIKHDIRVYLENQFDAMREERSLPHDWPSKDQIQSLVRLAAPLFIFAATACRYIGDPKYNPQRRLDLLLTSRNAKSSKLDSTYLPILNLLFEEEDEEDKERWITEFRTIVGSIVMLMTPLSIVALANLLNVSKFDISCRLDPLHSVLSVPEDIDLPIRSLHASLRDFLVDPKKREKSPIWIHERKMHEDLAWRCIELMSRPTGLRQDICNLELPRASKRNIDRRSLASSIPSELQYACSYWAEHVEQAALPISDYGKIHRFLMKHFIHWLEVMWLVGQSRQSLSVLSHLLSLVSLHSDVIEDTSNTKNTKSNPLKSPGVYAFLYDAEKFALSSYKIAGNMVLQLYTSALIFAPAKSIIRQTFSHYIAGWVERLSVIPGDDVFSVNTQRFHRLQIQAVTISHDCSKVVTAGYDMKLVLWDIATKNQLKTFSGHTDWISAVVFSPTDRLVASASYDTTVQLWNVATRSHSHALKGHSNAINGIVFVKDGHILASASDDMTVRLWNTSTGSCYSILQGHNSAVNAVAFSRDCQTVASASDDKTIRLWNVTTGECRIVLKGHRNRVIAVAFSHDDHTVASTSADQTIRVWNTTTGTCRQSLGKYPWVGRPLFSPDDRTIASAIVHKKLVYWNSAETKRGSSTVDCLNTFPAWKQCEDRLRTSPTEDQTPTTYGAPSDAQLDPHRLFVEGGWLFYKGIKLLRLPGDHHHSPTDVRGDLVCIGAGLSLTVLRFRSISSEWSIDTREATVI